MTKAELLEQLAEAENRLTALRQESVELGVRIHDIRAAFGNPFSYSRPEHPGEGPDNFTGYSSHAVSLPTILELLRVAGRIEQLTAQIATLDSQGE